MPTEKGVPLPAKKRGAEELAPELAQMEVLDSIFIPNLRGSGYPPVSGVGVAMYAFRSGKHFTSQYEDEGLRVWRLR